MAHLIQKTGITVLSVVFLAVIVSGIKNDNSLPDDQINNKEPLSIGTEKYIWKKMTDKAAFPESYNFQLVVHHDTLWALHPAGNWYSPDGKSWTKSALTNAISNLAFLDYIYFNKSLIGLGSFTGNSEKFSFNPFITKTSDFKTWEHLSAGSNLPKRFFYHPFSFNNRIWIIGGADAGTEYADIWNSEDGIHWAKQKDNLPFGKRAASQVVQLNKKLYLLNNDVWSSEDGLNWIKETDEILKGEQIFGYAAVVYDNHIWLLGCNRNGKFESKVLSSTDGKNWNANNAPWSPRGGIAACVFNGKIYMTGGKYGGHDTNNPEFVYSNDVWSMGKPGNN